MKRTLIKKLSKTDTSPGNKVLGAIVCCSLWCLILTAKALQQFSSLFCSDLSEIKYILLIFYCILCDLIHFPKMKIGEAHNNKETDFNYGEYLDE